MVNPRKKSTARSKSSNPKRKKPMSTAQAKALAKAWKARGKPVPAKIAAKARGSTRSKSTANPRKTSTRSKSRSKSSANPRKGVSAKRRSAAKKAWATRRRRYGKCGRKNSSTTRSKSRSNPMKKSSANPKSGGRVNGYTYYKPSLGRNVRVPGHPRKKSRRRNPATVKGFIPTFASIKKQFYFLPQRKMLYPTFKEIKQHPVFTIVGLPVGFVSSSAFGGIGRLIGGKNVLVSEALGFVGNVIGFELPARIVGMFNFKGKEVFQKSIRAGGIVATVISLLLGIVRIGLSLKKNGLKDTIVPKKHNFGVGQIKVNSLKELPKKAMKAMGLGLFSMNNPIADLVTSGAEQGYTGEEPMGVSDDFLSDEYMDEPDIVYGEEIDEDLSWMEDQTLGDSGLLSKIKELQSELGLSDDELYEMAAEIDYDEPELDGIGNSYVPSGYDGGFQDEFVQ